MSFNIQTKNLKGESNKSAGKTAKVKQNRQLPCDVALLVLTYAVSNARLLLCTLYSTFLLCL